MSDIIVKKKKSGLTENFDEKKIWCAIRKSADRVLLSLSDEDCKNVTDLVKLKIQGPEITVTKLHKLVEVSLDEAGFGKVAESYRQYRNYKIDAIMIMEAIDKKAIELNQKADRSNANSDSTLISTKRSLVYSEQQRERYKRIFLKEEERIAVEEGYIYIHDIGSRLDTYNCCNLNLKRILEGGFSLNDKEYVEPKSIRTALALTSDLIQAVAGCQFGGLTLPEIDTMLSKWVEMSYNKYYEEYKNIVDSINGIFDENLADNWAESKTRKDIEQEFQGLEYSLATISSSRGDFCFVSLTFGKDKTRWARMISEEILKVRKNGQGPNKVPSVFPKLIFLYDSRVHETGRDLEYLFDLAIDCTSKASYPDYLSLEPGSNIGDYYQKTGYAISPMGCRAFLSPASDPDTGEPSIYRCNLGPISLNLPMIYYKSVIEGKDFFEVFDYYLEMVRGINKRTVKYLSNLKASSSPLVFMEGGLDGGTLKADESVKPVFDRATISFGYIGLSEVGYMYNGKMLHEDQEFPLKVLKYMSDKISEFKKIDKISYASPYGTPAESWASYSCDKFKKIYGDIPGVTDHGYFTNSFHVCVRADITPIEKMDIEQKFFEYSAGGRISHIKVPDIKNKKGIKDLVKYGMNKGLYLGVNFAEDHCDDCGETFVGDDTKDIHTCPSCGSNNITMIRRLCGYLGYYKTSNGKTRINDGKRREIQERKNM